MRRLLSISALLIGFVMFGQVGIARAAVAESPRTRPNILILLADDLGFSDLGCYGSEIHTPNLDALAAGGLRFTQFYNCARCCPSRACLLTGLYPQQAGIGLMTGEGIKPGYEGHLTDRCVTIAEVLHAAGYGTYASGKWHVGDPGPIRRGFDEFFGYPHGYAVDSWDPKMMIRLPKGRPERHYEPGSFFATNAITDYAIDFLTLAEAKKDQPWFMYVAYQSPHFPIQAPLQVTATYVPIYQAGWDAIRDARFERMKKLGLMPPAVSISARGPIMLPDAARRIGSMTADGRNPEWDTMDSPRRADLAQRMAVFAAAVEVMDQNIGRLIVSLRQRGELDNTLILFLSDNGACGEWEPFGFDLNPAEFVSNKPGNGIDAGTPHRPNVLHTGDALAAMGGPGSMFSYGCGWANACNTPLRLYKHYCHEGGIRTPAIVHWPVGIAAHGEWRNQPSHLIDIMATCVELSGATYPHDFQGHPVLPPEGISLTAAFSNKPSPPRTFVFEHEHNAALRVGDWKLVAADILAHDGLRPGKRWELYNIPQDPTESHDLAADNPDVVSRMSDQFLKEARRTMILPEP